MIACHYTSFYLIHPSPKIVAPSHLFAMWASLQRGLHDMRQQLQDQLPELQQRLSQRMEQIGEHLDPLVRKMNALSTSSSREEEISLGEESRPVRLRILRKIGEGGYSFVYLAEVTASGQREGPWEVPGTHLALKKILAGGRDQLVEAQREINIMSKLRHPNLLRLIDATIVSVRKDDGVSGTGGASHVVYMVFPLYVSIRVGGRP